MNCLETKDIEDFIETITGFGCNKCRLANLVRTRIVVSRGNHNAKLMIVGQNPGAEEDHTGSPFVGPAGKLLDKMFESINIKTNDHIYLTNACLCWTPGNQDPSGFEGVIEACRPHLLKQIELIDPKLIIAVGKPAMESLCQRKIGSWLKHTCGNTCTIWGPPKPTGNILDRYPIFPIMHPAYLLRNPLDKPVAWEHMKKLSGLIEELNIIEGFRRTT